jgi:chromosomal replication initiation ATPase DnaA
MNIPRFQRSPIDTSVYNYMKFGRYHKDISIQKIRTVITKVKGVDPCDTTAYRGAKFIESRQLFMHFIRKYIKLTQDETGKIVDKDHSTVIYAEKCVGKFKNNEPRYNELYKLIDKQIQN